MEVLLLHVVDDVIDGPLEEACHISVAAGKLKGSEAFLYKVISLPFCLGETIIDTLFVIELEKFRVTKYLLDPLFLYPGQRPATLLRWWTKLLLRLREEVGCSGRCDS